MNQQTLNIPVEEVADFFLPLFQAYTDKLRTAFSQTKKKDYSEAEWFIISNNGNCGKLLKHHFLIESWDNFDLFLQRKCKLYCFIEEKAIGLVEKKYTFWVFFSPNDAGEYFKHQLEKPKNFNLDAIIAMPFIKMLDHMMEQTAIILNDKKSSVIDKVKKIFNILDLAEWYLPSDEIVQMDNHLKKEIVTLSDIEIEQLLLDIHNPGSSPIILEKRLNGLFRIGWRYFRAKNELETSYFKKLLSEKTEEREKGLRLAKKKVSDFRKALSQD